MQNEFSEVIAWNNLSSLIFYNKNSLDYEYLKKWAKYKEVEGLLNKLVG